MNTSEADLRSALVNAGVSATTQRLAVARVLFERLDHLSADQVFEKLDSHQPKVSRATVYNTLSLFVEKGLIRELHIDSSKVFYDSNTASHYHIYDSATGTITDIGQDQVKLTGGPTLPDGKKLDQVEIVFRISDT